jgi:hypothetical protein
MKRSTAYSQAHRTVHRALAESVELFEAGLANCHRAEDRALVERYLAALAPVLADAVLGKEVLSRLGQIERLFGNSWLMDQEPFQSALEKWHEFRREYERFAVGGMTVNERLHAYSLTEDFDRAFADRDAETVKRILKTVHVDDDSIARVLTDIEGDA